MAKRPRQRTPGETLWWGRTVRLAIGTLAVWFVFGFLVHGFVFQLNDITIADFPLGFYMAAQGSLVVFVALIFWFCGRQEAIDRNAGVAEPEPVRGEMPL